MAEVVSYWICSCGKSNLNQTKVCPSCQKRRPRRWGVILAGIAGVIFVVAAIASGGNSVSDATWIPESQKEFLGRIEAAKSQAELAPNSLALSQLLKSRNAELASVGSIENWQGKVLGIQSMREGGALGIDLGGVEIVAGVHEKYGINTLVAPNTDVFNAILSMERGGNVIFSGRFFSVGGEIVQLNYSDSGAISSPRFIFAFSDIRKVD